MFVIVFCNKKITNYYTIEQDSENCTDLEKVESIVTHNKNLGDVFLYNLDCFKNNICVSNNSRSNYFANKHLIKYICKQLNVKYFDLHINTEQMFSIVNDKKIHIVLDSKKNQCKESLNNTNNTNKCSLIHNKNFINTVIKLLAN